MKAKLTVARMWQDTVKTKWSDSYADLLLYSQLHLCGPGEYIHLLKGAYSWFEVRNDFVEDMQGEWLLQLDTDHCFAPDTLERLLRLATRHNARVISGIYQYKHPPHNPVVGLWTPEGRVAPLLDWPRNLDVLEVGVTGAGCLLVHRSVFNRIRRELKEQPFSIRPGLSEDYSFCQRCRDLAIPVHLALNVECHHVIDTVLSIRDYTPPASPTVGVSGGRIVDTEGVT